MTTGLPTLAKTWQFNVNNAQSAQGSALADNRQLLLNIKNALTGFAIAAWTTRYSCNSVTAGTAGDGVDRWSTQSNVVWNSSGSAHSWFVMRQTGIATNTEFLVSCEGSSATGNAITWVVSPTAGFTAGSTTARPTATDEIVILNGAGWSGINADVACRWSVMQASDGSCTRIIVAFSGAMAFLAFFDVPANTTTGWSNPAVFYAVNNNQSSPGTLTNTLTIKAKIGSTTTSFNASCEGSAAGTLGPSDTTYANIANEVDGNWPMWPMGINSTTVGVRGRHGSLQDIWFGSTAVGSGDSYPATGTTGQFAQFGCVIVPWNNGAVNLT